MTNRNLLVIALVIVLVALAVFVLLWAFLRQEEPTPTPVPTFTTAPTDTSVPTEPPAPEDEVWSRIQAAGKMVVGTSADYPPFEYYGDGFQLDGFDIALVREIGVRLGLDVEIRDMAFDGLGGALQLGQIDVAIAALSITPERTDVVDFSNVYFVTEDAVLAIDDTVTINSPRDFAGKRIGVQYQSVHEQWAQDQLVDAGFVDQTDLILYREIDRSVDDLANGLVDLVIADLPPAELAVESRGFAIAAQGLNRQRFGIALPKGAAVLQAQLNRALGELQAEGFIDDLAEMYLGLEGEDLIPIPTPDPSVPTPTPRPPTPPTDCVDGMQWVADLSFDDKNMTDPPQFAPGQPFVKSWRVRNTGTCDWSSSYALVYAGGNTSAARMGGQPSPVSRLVRPGETYDFNVDLVAPLVPGTYQAFWTMRNDAGKLFGDRVWVGVQVVGAPTATPPPTQTPSPSIQFTVDRTQIRQGECVTFQWRVENVQAVYFHADGQDWRDQGVAGEGSRTECPPTTTTYNLRVVFRDGTTEVRKTRIDVQPAPVDAPYIARFSVVPEGQIFPGQCVDIAWDVQGQVNSVRLARNNTDLWNPAPQRGDLQDCPPGPGSYGYTIEATGPGGTSRAQRNVTVVQPTAPPPTNTPVPPTPQPPPPVIQAFAVNPNQIERGQCVQVSWRVAGNVNLVQIVRNERILLDRADFEGSAQDCLTEVGTYTYRLVASNNAGLSDTRQQAVSVGEAAPQNPLADTNWRLASLNVNQVPLPDTIITAFFDASGGVGGSSGCNTYNGPYTVSGSNLSAGPFAGGGALCGDDVDQQEQLYLSTFASAATFEISGNQLIIRDAAGQEVLRFNRIG